METAKSLLAIPTGLKGLKLFRNRTEHSSVYFHSDSKVFCKTHSGNLQGKTYFATVFW